MRVLESFILCVALGAAIPALANEGGGEGGGEAAKSEKGGMPEWAEIQNRLQTLRAKVTAKEKIVRELIRDKQNEKDARKSVEIVENLKREHREFEAAAEEYEQQRNLLKYRFPEKGLKEERRYRRVDVRSLDEMETQMSMEGQLKKSLGKVRQQYGTPEEKAAAEKPKEKAPPETGAPAITEPPVMAK